MDRHRPGKDRLSQLLAREFAPPAQPHSIIRSQIGTPEQHIEFPDRFIAEGIYPPNAWLDQGDRWLCLYTGTASKHNQTTASGAPFDCIMAASWPKQRFVGLRAERVPGGFLTPVFYLQAPEMRVDANVRGWLRAELCDAWGRKHEGYHLEDSIPAQGDDQAHILRWHGQAEAEANPQPQAAQEAETAEAGDPAPR